MKKFSQAISVVIGKLPFIYPLILKKATKTYFFFFGSKVECNICHFKGNVFESDSWHKFTICPNCWSSVRQRLLWAMLNWSSEWNLTALVKGKTLLHFAPDQCITKKIKDIAGVYKTADFLAAGYVQSYPDIDYNLDISEMPTIGNDEYDCLIACDVLEHVYDDKKAIDEMYRVLKLGGYCILTVPQKDHLEKTYEDKKIVHPAERKEKFGQEDHVRIYGSDFIQLMKNGGFETYQVDEKIFDAKKRVRHVLFPPVLSDHPLATNHRKIFIGQKRLKTPQNQQPNVMGTELQKAK